MFIFSIAAAIIISILLFYILVGLSDKFIQQKQKKQDIVFWKHAEQYENKSDDSIQAKENQSWAEDMRRLLSLNALNEEKGKKLLELGIITKEELGQSRQIEPPKYSFNPYIFALAFIPALAIGFFFFFYSLQFFTYAVIYALTSIISIIMMTFIAITDQKSHMIPFSIACPTFLISLLYAVIVIFTGICPATYFILGFAISILVFGIPYAVFKIKGTTAFGVGDMMLLPSYALLIAPAPILGLVATVIVMLIVALFYRFTNFSNKHMPMGPFLAFGACFSIGFALITIFGL